VIMPKWKHRSLEEKKKILARTRGYPFLEELEAYASKIPERRRFNYFMDWLRFHKNFGVYDNDTLAEFYGYLMYSEKMRMISPLLERFSDQFAAYNALTMGMPKDSPFVHQRNASLQEILGPDGGTFEKDALPSDYVPSWERYKQEYLEKEFQVKDHVQEG